MSGGANSTTGGEGSADPVLNSLMMRSPDLGDPVSLLERRVLYFISGTPLTQMHIALPRGQWRLVFKFACKRCGLRPASNASAAHRRQESRQERVLRIAQGCNDECLRAGFAAARSERCLAAPFAYQRSDAKVASRDRKRSQSASFGSPNRSQVGCSRKART